MAPTGRRRADSLLIALLAGGAKVEDAARAAGVSERTAFRRLKDEAFRLALTQARQALLSELLGRLSKAALVGVETLEGIASGSIQGTPLTVKAATALLRSVAGVYETVETARRLDSLERMIDDAEIRTNHKTADSFDTFSAH